MKLRGPADSQDWRKVAGALLMATFFALVLLVASVLEHRQGVAQLTQPAPGPLDLANPSS